jgi:hypothetical protein
MHACLLHIYNHAFALFIFIVIYLQKSVMTSREKSLLKQRLIFNHAYIMHLAISWFHVLKFPNDIKLLADSLL